MSLSENRLPRRSWIPAFAGMTALLAMTSPCLYAAVLEVGDGKTYSTIQACANAAQAGDTCLVYAGNYDKRVTPSRSGTSGNSITFLAASGPRPRVRGFTLRDRSHITVEGFEITNQAMSPDRNASFEIGGSVALRIMNNHVHDTSSYAIQASPFSANQRATGLVVRNNSFERIGGADRDYTMRLRIDHSLIESNDSSDGSDFINLFGTRNVLRNNIWRNTDEANDGGGHPDFAQSYCNPNNSADCVSVHYLLIENNIARNNVGRNVHFILFNGTEDCGTGANDVLARFNLIDVLGSAAFWGNADPTPDSGVDYYKIYTNTVYKTRHNSRRGGTTNNVNGSNHVSILNNIYVDAVAVNARSKTMHRFGSTGTDESNYNLVYMTSGPVTWVDPINSEPNSIRNQAPRFVSNSDFNLESGSAALDAGGSLTRVSAGDSGSGTTLRVTDVHFFQDGWAGVSPDWIAVGTTVNAAQIASIDYANNIITLAAAISRSPNDPVWLYKDSNGRQVLYGSAPDIGAYEYGSGSPPPSDTTPRVISSASAWNITQTSASITWNTDENADSQIDYGTTASYGSQTIRNASLVTSHSQTLSGLSAGALYHYRVRSKNAAGNLAISGDHTFTTQAW